MPDPITHSIEEKVQLATQVPGPRAAFADSLWEQMSNQSPLASRVARPARPAHFLRPHLRPAWILLFIALLCLLSLAVIGPQKVAAAFRSLFGYIPGIGFVENADEIRLLDGPVQIEHGDITAFVEEGAADGNGTRLNLRVEGLPTFVFRAGEDETLPFLQLANGQRLSLLSGQTQGGDPLLAQYFFPALPNGTEDAILALPFLDALQDGEAAQEWYIPIHFRLPGEGEVLPAYPLDALKSETHQGITLVIDEIAQDGDSVLLKVHLQSDDVQRQPTADWWTQLSLTGQDGKIYPLADVPDAAATSSARTLRTPAIAGSQHLSLRLESLAVSTWFPLEGSAPGFRFDPGRAPAVGQRWALDETLETGGFPLHFTQVEWTTGERGAIQLRFSVEPQPGLLDVILACDPQAMCTGSTTYPPAAGGVLQSSLSLEEIPARPLHVRLARLLTHVSGPWQVSWQPLGPDATARPVPTSTSTPVPVTPTLEALLQQPLAQEMDTLAQRAFERLYGQPGWVHIVAENVVPEDGGFLLGPAHTIGEYWQYVEVDGTLSQYALLVKDPQGDLWQKIARVGNRQVDFLAQTAQEDDDLPTRVQPDTLPEEIERTLEQGGQAEQAQTVLDGQPCRLITLIDIFDPPLQIGGTELFVERVERMYWIDPDSGDILLRERYDHLTDGTRIAREHLRILVQERVDAPPPEILELLSQVQ